VRKINYALLVVFLAFFILPAEEYEQKINRSFPLSANGSIELSSINGSIVVTTSSDQAVDIKAIKKSDYKDEIETIEIIFEAGKDTLKVYTKANKRNTRAKVDFTVALPDKLARAVFQSVNGKLDCSGKFADLTLKTVNGKIDFSGEFRNTVFKTVNGAIAVSQETLLSGNLTAATVNGAIAIELNRKSAFAAEGRTVNGRISNDFDLAVERHLVGSSFRGKVNEGGQYKVNVETVNGSIDIAKI
jgi:DUF4097 and DUF4098 domain-containing protein YvlB